MILTSRWEQVEGMRPSAIDNETYFLGFRTTKIEKCSTKDYKNEIGVIIVDIIPEFELDIQYAEINDEKARVVMFEGETGARKTTEVNA